MNNRRDFLKKGALLGLTGIVGSIAGAGRLDEIENAANTFSAGSPAFKLPPLPYAYDALEPFIDKQTMEIHHTKHHQGYIDKLNNTASTNIDYQASDESKCKSIDSSAAAVVRNNLGGYYNHSLFWTLLKPNSTASPNVPTGKLAEAIKKDFGSFENLKKEFSETAVKIFGSGWCWIIVQNDKLKITTTPNQDNPLMKVVAEQGRIIMALDVWEHAYYLKYQNKRADYIAGWWNIVNWGKAEELYTAK
ncbi:MAG: superoxide dismutase [Bacteroidota bacterium]